MRIIFRIIILLMLPIWIFSQEGDKYLDNLKQQLNHSANDTIRMNVYRQLGFYHQDSDADTALVYHMAQRDLAEKLKLKLWEADAYQQIAYCYSRKYKFSEAYENYMLALKIAEDPSSALNGWGYSNFSYAKSLDEARRSIIGMIHFELSTLYTRTRYYKESFNQLIKALEIGESLQNKKILSLTNRDIGVYYFDNNKPDSAFIYLQKSLEYYQNSPYQKNLGFVQDQIGLYYLQKKKYDSAKIYFRNAIDENIRSVSLVLVGKAQRDLGRLYIETGQLDSALHYTLMGQKMADSINDLPGKATGFTQLGSIYQLKKEYAVAYDYLQRGKDLGDNIADALTDRLMQFQNLDFDQKFRLQELEKENQQEKSRNRMLVMLMGLGIFLLVAILLYRNNRQKQKANSILQSTLSDLRSTQAQLIQSEKMASLGELTAGIAHEIQNPLNFVNNFSDVNSEMIDEASQEIDNGNLGEAKAILKDLKENQDKINHHGKRADEIVKGMLQHSRSSSGIKEPTDINALCDEYLRLAYHGLRAKDKSFNAKFEMDFDNSIEKINVVPQDIGRVVLNLINNAFYAVNEKAKHNIPGYEPIVIVKTSKNPPPVGGGRGAEIVISVKDNGNGIPDAIKEKIFQPFFTTKPTGSGTGLGLSLSYDIVNAHGGEIKLNTRENEGTEFIIQLPV